MKSLCQVLKKALMVRVACMHTECFGSLYTQNFWLCSLLQNRNPFQEKCTVPVIFSTDI